MGEYSLARLLPVPFQSKNTHAYRQCLSSPIYRGTPLSISFRKRADARAADTIFVQMLWAAFPARSENHLAEMAAPKLGVSPKTVRNWLRGNGDGKAKNFADLMKILGVDKTLEILEGVPDR